VAGHFPLLTDENVPGPLIEGLKARGWNVLRVVDVFGERSVDPEVFAHAAERGLVLASTDRDCLVIARPMFLHRVEIGVGRDGLPSAWRHVIVGQSLLAGTPFASMIKNGVDDTAVEGASDTHYAIPNLHVSVHHPQVNVPVLWWRSVGHTHTAFVMETLIDELAARAKVDPIAYRRRLLRPDAKKPRTALDLMAEKSAPWRNQLPRNHAVGIACHESFETAVACAVDVSIENNRPRIHRATVAVDAGLVVNPLSIESQCQGGLTVGLSQLMAHGAITLKDGRVEQSNFDEHTPRTRLTHPSL
jgi:isoquinoline 1-oxidoreductase subunit beta